MTEPTPGDFDSVLHSGARITIMSRLVIHKAMGFAALEKSTTLTGGNLAAHLKVLAKAGYVEEDVDDRKVTRRKLVRITPAGDEAFRAYVAQVRAVLDGVQASLAVPIQPGHSTESAESRPIR